MRFLPTAKEPEVLSPNRVDELVKHLATICVDRNVIQILKGDLVDLERFAVAIRSRHTEPEGE